MANRDVTSDAANADLTTMGTSDKFMVIGVSTNPDSLKEITKANLAASTTATGLVELATNAETVTGTDTARATTPAGVAAAIAAINGVTATASGTGDTSLTANVSKKNLSGGLNSAPVDVSNTAALIAAQINLLSGITAVATGTGASSLSAAETKKNFLS